MAASKTTTSDGKRGGWRAYWLHAALVAVLLIELGVGLALRTPNAQLAEKVKNGTPQARIAAVFRMTNRTAPEAFSPEALRRMLYSQGGLLAEWAMTPTMTRNAPAIEQETFLRAIGSSPGATLCRVLLQFQPGKYGSLTLADVAAFLRASP